VERETGSYNRWLVAVLALPSIGVLWVWLFTAANERFFTRESFLVYPLAMCVGGPASLLGLVVGATGLSTSPPADRRWWWVCVAASGAGLAANCAGFVGYVAPAC
jgi:hypothetical protein